MKLFNKYNFSLSLCLMTLLMTSNALADSLDKLVKDIKEQAQLEARRDQEREQRFRASLSDQTQLLNEAQTAVSQAEKLRDQLHRKSVSNLAENEKNRNWSHKVETISASLYQSIPDQFIVSELYPNLCGFDSRS